MRYDVVDSVLQLQNRGLRGGEEVVVHCAFGVIEKSGGKERNNPRGGWTDESGHHDRDRIQTFEGFSSVKELCGGIHRSFEEHFVKSGNTFVSNRL